MYFYFFHRTLFKYMHKWVQTLHFVAFETAIELKTSSKTDVLFVIVKLFECFSKIIIVVKLAEHAESCLCFHCLRLQSYLYTMREFCWACCESITCNCIAGNSRTKLSIICIMLIFDCFSRIASHVLSYAINLSYLAINYCQLSNSYCINVCILKVSKLLHFACIIKKEIDIMIWKA